MLLSRTVIKTCEGCQSEFTIYRAWLRNGKAGKYCSVACARKYGTRPQAQLLSAFCINCGVRFERRKNRAGSMMYCSNECRHAGDHMPSGDRHPKWKGGVSDRTFAARKVIKDRVAFIGKCEECGATDGLHGHHKKPWASHPELREDPDNIEVLCGNCHAEHHPELKNMLTIPRIRSGLHKNCEICETSFYIPMSKEKTARFCSRQCQLYYLNVKRHENGEAA